VSDTLVKNRRSPGIPARPGGDRPSPLQLLRSARYRRDLAEVVRIARQVIARKPEHAVALRAVARTLEAIGRRDEALASWTALRDLDPADIEAAFRVARAAAANGCSFAAAAEIAAPQANGLFRKHLQLTLEAPLEAAGGVRHVAIGGVSFCGSTMLDRVLGGLAGVRSIGESHWLTTEHDGQNYVPRDLGSKRTGRGPFCTVCGRSCKVLTDDFRAKLTVDPQDWYQKIAHRLGTAVLVSADKNPVKFVDQDPLLRLSALVVFKSPLQAWASKLTKLPQGRDDEYYAQELTTYLKVWTDSYRCFLDDFKPMGGKAFLFFDEFADKPGAVLPPVCAALSLPWHSGVLQRTRPGHAIGGNSGAMAQLRSAEYGVEIKPLPAPNLPAAHVEVIDNDQATQQCFADLMKHYGRLVISASAGD
jgi:hypothetical protein